MRLASRVPVSLRADWCVPGRTARVVSDIENLSAGGAFIATSIAVPAGTTIRLSLLTDGGIVPTVARVVRASRRGMAVRFDSGGAADAPAHDLDAD